MNTWSSDALIKAWEFAAQAHHGQSYATAQPELRLDYLTHVGAVTLELMSALAQHQPPGLNSELALHCAILHDVLEDTPYSYADLCTHFGQAVADGVQALSKNPNLAPSMQMSDSLARIRQQPSAVWAVKLADRIHNLSAPPAHWTLERKQAYQHEAQLIHTQLHTAHSDLAARLQAKILAYAQYF